MQNSWNKKIYAIWSPIYDQFFNRGFFRRARAQVFQDERIENSKNILFVGVGTGAELTYIRNKNLKITAIDLSREMLDEAEKKGSQFTNITFMEMDAQNLSFEPGSFDLVVASLILSVVPDPNRCFQEILRVTQSGGTILIFDKFAPEGSQLSLGKKLLRPLISLFGTDIGRHFEKISSSEKDQIIINENRGVMFNGMFRKIVLRKR